MVQTPTISTTISIQLPKAIAIYCFGKEVEVLVNPSQLSGEDVLPGFVLDLKRV